MTVAVLLVLLLLGGASTTICARSLTCTVGEGADFTDLIDAVKNCRGNNATNITLLIHGVFQVGFGNLSFPIDIENITIQSGANGTDATIQGGEFLVDLIQPYPALNFVNITFDLLDTNSSLFSPQLTNQNLTIVGCVFQNVAAQNSTPICTNQTICFFFLCSNVTECVPQPTLYLLKGEACMDQVYLTLVNNTFSDVHNGAIYFEGLAAFNLQQNSFPSSGDNVTTNSSFVHLRLSDISTTTSYFNENDQWRVVDCRGLRCLYAIFADTYEFECNQQGQLQCIDRTTMDQNALAHPDACTIGDYSVYDEYTNQTVTVSDDFNPLCTTYIPCPCNNVIFQNVTSGQQLYFPVGNIVLKSGEVLPCVPAPGALYTLLPPDVTYVSVTNIIVGDQFVPGGLYDGNPSQIGVPNGMAQALTALPNGSYIVFLDGIIVNPLNMQSTCNCTGTGPYSQRDPYTIPCEYLVLPPYANNTVLQAAVNASLNLNGPSPNITYNGAPYTIPFNITEMSPSFCQETVVYCCEPPGMVSVIYKTDCSLSPYACEPVIYPNGTLVDPFAPPIYNCDYLANCSYAPTNDGIEGCTAFQCDLLQCFEGVEYTVGSKCWNALNLGSSSTQVVMNLDSATSAGATFSITFDGSGSVDNAVFSGVSATGFFVNNIHIAISSYFVVSSNGSTAVWTLVGGALDDMVITNAILSNGTNVGTVTITSGSTSGLNGQTIVAGSIVSGEFTAPYPQCNDFLVPTSDPMCLFARSNCSQYYGPYNYLLPNYAPYGTAPSGGITVVPQVCTFTLDQCVYFNDTRCSCANYTAAANRTACESQAPSSLTGFINYTVVFGSIITSNISNLPPTLRPVTVLPRVLSRNQIPCPTDLWFQCPCPPYYALDDNVQVCVPSGDVNCTSQSMTVQQCLDTDNCTLPPPPSDWSFYLNSVPLSCHTADDTVQCNCGAYLIATAYPPADGSVTYELLNFPPTSSLQIIDNSGCGLFNAMKIKQLPASITDILTIAPQPWFDDFSAVRNIAVQRNEFLIGTESDVVENDWGTPYRRECTSQCPGDYRAPSTTYGYECIVDASVDTGVNGYGTVYFSSLYQLTQAIQVNGSCSNNRTVLVLYTAQYYAEPEDFSNNPLGDTNNDIQLVFGSAMNNFLIASLDGAVVVGDNFGIDAKIQNLTFVGITFIHSGDNQNPIFTLYSEKHHSIGLVTFYDCIFDGKGARGSSIIDMTRLAFLDMRYCLLINWNYYALRLLDAVYVTFYDNVVQLCEGRCIQLRFATAFRFEGNTFIDSRGGSGLLGPSLVFLLGGEGACAPSPKSASFDNSFSDCFFGLPGCSSSTDINPSEIQAGTGIPDPYVRLLFLQKNPAANHFPCRYSMMSMTSDGTRMVPAYAATQCAIRRNIHLTDVTADDYTDTFITLSGSQMNMTSRLIADNGVLKCQYGMAFLNTANIGGLTDQDLMARYNPLVRPHLYRIVDPANGVLPGYDFRGWGYTSGSDNFFAFLFSSTSFQCNWPCNSVVQRQLTNKTKVCEVNNNWDIEILPWQDYQLGQEAYGYLRWHNISHGILYCEDFQTVDGLPMQYIYATTFGGSRYLVDNITMIQDGWIVANTSQPGTWCTTQKGFRPCVRGNGHTCETGRCRMTDMSFELSTSIVGLNLWQSGEVDNIIPYDVEIYGCIFDGRSLPVYATALALDFDIGGLAVLPRNVDFRQLPQNSLLPALTNGTFIMYNSTLQNFTSFPTDVTITQANQQGVISLSSYPYVVYCFFSSSLVAD
jgi:hypothetical protein